MKAKPRPPPPADARTLPARFYLDDVVFDRELDRIFGRMWICAGRAEAVSQGGRYFVREIGRESVIVVSDRDGVLRAVFNVCRHRGTRICTEPNGRFGETIQCPYHAWTYALDGRLVGAPHMDNVPGFDRADYPLHPVGLDTWDGHIFINLDAGRRSPAPIHAGGATGTPTSRQDSAFGGGALRQAQGPTSEGAHVREAQGAAARASQGSRPGSLMDQLADLPEKFRAWQMRDLRSAARIVYDVRANWKLIIQNYSECLHCPVIHPALERLSHYLSGENEPPTPAYLGGRMDLRDGVETISVDGRRVGACLPGLDAADRGRVYYYAVFPNLLLTLHPDYVMTHTLWPRRCDRTEIVCEWHFHPARMAQPDFTSDEAVRIWDETNRQDWHVSELSQLGIQSRVYAPGPYSDREDLLYAFDKMIVNIVDGQP